MKRRQFLALTATAVAALAFPLNALPRRRSLRILILGGTGFIGPHQVETALGRGHEVTIFNRGRTQPHMFPHIENLTGDRSGDLAALKGRKWDAVIDNSGFLPRWVKESVKVLKPNVDHYLYMSSLSVYADHSIVGQTEDGALLQFDDKSDEKLDAANYGALSAQSESYVQAAYPDRSTLVRSGLVVGPGDPTDRFTYWPARLHQGGDVLAPGSPQDPIQCIDVRDLAAWIIRAVEERHFGPYNLTGPYHQLTMGEFLNVVSDTVNSDSELIWVSPEFLQENGVQPWTDLPLWVPSDSDMKGFVQVDISRAVDAQLTFRPLATTVQDSLAWHRTLDDGSALRAGLDPEREKELLKRWRELSIMAH